MIHAEGLTKWFLGERPAVDHVSFHVARGEVYCLLGADGAGKTTILDMILGLVLPTGGRARVRGEVAHPSAYLPAALPASLTPVENVLFQCRFAGVPARSAHDVRDLLRGVGIPEKNFTKRTSELSRAQMQMLGLAVVSARRAKAVLADDPAAGLPPTEAEDFLKSLVRLRESGASILYATSDVYVARRIADRIGILRQGLLILELNKTDLKEFDLDALYRSPSHTLP
jgi:ABC-2 type transport system ATP-binding protein